MRLRNQPCWVTSFQLVGVWVWGQRRRPGIGTQKDSAGQTSGQLSMEFGWEGTVVRDPGVGFQAPGTRRANLAPLPGVPGSTEGAYLSRVLRTETVQE